MAGDFNLFDRLGTLCGLWFTVAPMLAILALGRRYRAIARPRRFVGVVRRAGTLLRRRIIGDVSWRCRAGRIVLRHSYRRYENRE